MKGTTLGLSQLFILNFVGFALLAAALLFGGRKLGRSRWIVDALLIAYTAATIIAWIRWDSPNPMGLGYASKVLEILLITAIAAHLFVRQGLNARTT